MKKLKEFNQLINNESNILLIVQNIDRFSRSVEHGSYYLDIMQQKNILLYSIEQQLYSNNIENISQIKNCIIHNELYSKQLSRRIKNIQSMIRNKGGYIGGIPFGYSIFKDNNKIPRKILNKHEQKIIKLIINLKISLSSSKNLTKSIRDIKNNNNEDELEFIDENQNIINYFDKPFTLDNKTISEILNNYNILKRKKKWTPTSVAYIVKKNICKKTKNNIRKNHKNKKKILNNFKKMSI